jgi:hypothetical protein
VNSGFCVWIGKGGVEKILGLTFLDSSIFYTVGVNHFIKWIILNK